MARANWGGTWRIPTLNEMKELKEKCIWTTLDGYNGYRVIGPNGNSIFLPAAGFRYLSSLKSGEGDGFYWSSTPYENSMYAYDLRFYGGDYDWHWSDRFEGKSIRPVSE